MNTKKVIVACLTAASVGTICSPVFAYKIVPATTKVGLSNAVKSTKTIKLSAKEKKTTLISKKCGKKKKLS